MENKQQTAVQWFFRWVNDNLETTHEEFAAAFEQAKAMEENQHVQTFKAGQESMEEGGKNFEQYFKTYAK